MPPTGRSPSRAPLLDWIDQYVQSHFKCATRGAQVPQTLDILDLLECLVIWFVWDPKHETLHGWAWSVSPSAPVRTSGAEWARNSLLPFRSTLSSLLPFRLRLCPFSPPSLTPAQGKYLTENTRHSNKSNMSNVWGTYTPGLVADLKWDWTFWFVSSQNERETKGRSGGGEWGRG